MHRVEPTGCRATRSRGCREAFSIIDLVAAVACAAVLLALATHVAVSTHETTIECAAKLRELGQLTTSFADERGGQAPIAGELFGVSASSFNNAYLPEELMYYGSGPLKYPLSLEPTLASFGGKEITWPSGGLGSPSGPLPTWQTIVQCPEDSTFDWNVPQHLGVSLAPAFGANSPYAVRLLTSYSTNEHVLGRWPTGERLFGRLERVRNPAQTFLFADGEPDDWSGEAWMPIWDDVAVRRFNMWQHNEYQDPYALLNRFDTTRHDSGMNTLFSDGHVDRIPLEASSMQRVLISN